MHLSPDARLKERLEDFSKHARAAWNGSSGSFIFQDGIDAWVQNKENRPKRKDEANSVGGVGLTRSSAPNVVGSDATTGSFSRLCDDGECKDGAIDTGRRACYTPGNNENEATT